MNTSIGRLLLVSLAMLGLAACGDSEATKPAVRLDPAPRPVPVVSGVVQDRSLARVLDVTGTLAADAHTDVATEKEGRVVQVLVERGMVVEAGAVLARLDQTEAVTQLREAEATEAQTRARLGLSDGQPFDPRETPEAHRARALLDRAEAEYQRYARLVEQGIVSRSEYDARRADALAARAQLEETVNQARQLYQTLQAQDARVVLARKELADVTVRAPWGGLVAEKHATVGQYLVKGGRVATLVRMNPLRVELTIPETAIAAVAREQKVAFRVQAYPDRQFAGTIAYVGPALRVDSRALVVEALVPNPDGVLRPGFFATARIELPATQPALMVPVAALRRDAGVSRLYVVKDGRAEERIVQVGRELEGWVEVVRGVSAGERIVTGGVDRVADGVAVIDGPGEVK